MLDFNQERAHKIKADALAEALRQMASKIEHGCYITEEQENKIIELSREILFGKKSKNTQSNKIVKLQPKNKNREEEQK